VVLPSPTELAALGTALLVGAGLVFFLKSPSLAFDLAIAGALTLAAASIAYGYYAMGEDHIRPQLVACEKKIEEANARAQSFFDQAASKVAQLEALTKEKNAAIAKLTVDFNARLDAQAAEVRNIVVPASAGELLQPAIDAANGAASVAGRFGGGATTTAAVARDTTLGAVEGWAGAVVSLYADCASRLTGIQELYTDLQRSSAQLKPVN
jgi:hypothetical protein